MTTFANDPSMITDTSGQRVAATLDPRLLPSERTALCADAVGHLVNLSFRYPQSGRSFVRCTVDRLGVLDGPNETRPVMIVLFGGGAHVISLAAIATWQRAS